MALTACTHVPRRVGLCHAASTKYSLHFGCGTDIKKPTELRAHRPYTLVKKEKGGEKREKLVKREYSILSQEHSFNTRRNLSIADSAQVLVLIRWSSEERHSTAQHSTAQHSTAVLTKYCRKTAAT